MAFLLQDRAHSFVNVARDLLKDENDQIGFKHPAMPNLNYISNSSNELENKAVEEAFARSVLFGFEIIEKSEKLIKDQGQSYETPQDMELLRFILIVEMQKN